mgnify:CR=1 FL=1
MRLTMTDIKRNNKEAGHHFFDRDTMRFFNSRIESGLYKDNTFITSEQFDYNSPREYTIRRVVDGGIKIETIGEFGQFETLEDAKIGRKKFNGEITATTQQ